VSKLIRKRVPLEAHFQAPCLLADAGTVMVAKPMKEGWRLDNSDNDYVLYCRGESGKFYKVALMLNLCSLD